MQIPLRRADVKKALDSDDIEEIGRTAATLGTVSQKMGQAMYDANAAAGAAGDGTTASGSDDDVVDAEIVDEPSEGDGSAA